MYDKTIIVGRLGRDPEMRYTGDGTPVTNLNVAVDRMSKGEKVTQWFRVSVWRKQAEACNQYLTKGRMVLCEGQVGVNAYTGNDGQARASLELTAYTVKFLDGGDKQSGNGNAIDDNLFEDVEKIPF